METDKKNRKKHFKTGVYILGIYTIQSHHNIVYIIATH